MKTGSRTNAAINSAGMIIILLTVIIRLLENRTGLSRDFHAYAVRNILYILFFLLWMITIKRRVIQKHIRRFLMAAAALEIFWITVRCVKFEMLKSDVLIRYAWYLYYLPMLMIPSLCLLLAVSMGKPENCGFRKGLVIFPVIAAALFLLVMTNDIHRTVFIIPDGPDGMEVGNYSYGASFAVISAYIGLCYIGSYGIILTKCRLPKTRPARFLPLLPMTFGAAVSVLNIMGVRSYFGLFNIDITVAHCLCTTLTLEACIQSGLILTNSGYDELFRLSCVRAVITDKNGSPIIFSDTCEEIPEKYMREAEKAPVMLENGIRLSSAPIKQGRVFWQDDLSEQNKVLSELSGINDYLQGKSAALQQAYDYQKKERRLIEKNRLYNRILTQTKREIELYASLVEQLAAETDPVKTKALAVKTAFVSAFIKRRDNLIFLSEEEKPIDPSELSYCIEESLSNLRLGGAECYCSCELEKPLGFDKMSGLYEKFYKVVLGIIDSLSSLCVYLIEEDGEAAAVMRILCSGGEKPAYPDGDGIRAEKEEDEWVVTVR